MRLFPTVVLAAALSTSLASVQAQEASQSSRSTSIGLMVGSSLTTISGEDTADDLERLTRMLAGVSVVTSLTPRIQLEIDALYAGKGFRSPGTVSFFDVTTGYLAIPALLRIGLTPNARVHPFLTVGPAFGYQMSCKTTTTTAAASLTADCQDGSDAATKLQKTDFSAVAGAGLEFSAGPVQLTFAARFTRGFKSLYGNAKNHNEALNTYFSISRAR